MPLFGCLLQKVLELAPCLRQLIGQQRHVVSTVGQALGEPVALGPQRRDGDGSVLPFVALGKRPTRVSPASSGSWVPRGAICRSTARRWPPCAAKTAHRSG